MAVTFASPIAGSGGSVLHLENQTITNQTDNTRAHARAIAVPQWAKYATFYLNVTSMAGTSPLLDFKLEAVDPVALTAVSAVGSWDGITQKTGTAALITVDVGPGLTADDSGSATASCNYAVNAPLPPVLLYTITTDGTTDDEDYAFTLAVSFKG